jgi:rhodanese-related sulfurtransferase
MSSSLGTPDWMGSYLQQKGYDQVYFLAGGTFARFNAGYPLVQ